MQKEVIILSFSDWLFAIKKHKKLICLVGFSLAICFFFTKLQKPLEYTSRATFKASYVPQSSVLKAFEFLGGAIDSYSSSDDPKSFLNAYPVMEQVAKSLCLQAKITEKNKNPGRLKRMWRSLKADRLYAHFSKQKPLAHILSRDAVITDKPIIFNEECPLECIQLEYSDEISRILKIVFLDKKHFEVFESKKLGKGQLNVPFTLDSLSFTLRSNESLKKRVFFISLIPLHAAATGLQKSLILKKDKIAPSMIHLSFTHSSPRLSACVVNRTMEEFQNFLKEEGKQKITQQIGYLKQRQMESLADLEEVMEKHKTYLEEHLEQGQMVTLENELDFFSQKQGTLQSEQNNISIEMQNLQKLFPKFHPYSFEDLLKLLREDASPKPTQKLSLDTAHELLLNHQEKLGVIFLEKDEYAFCLSKLAEPGFDAATFSKLLKDPSLNSRFDKIHTLHRNLVDDKNFTEKEKSLIHEQLECEKTFLKKHLNHLQEGLSIEENVLKERILSLQEALFFLLFERHELIEKNLKDLAEKALSFPEKWLSEQKIELNTKLQSEMCESITKMIEAKNISYHLEYLSGGPLMRASFQALPDPPKLFLHALFGFLAGAFLTLLGIFFREIWLGPRSTLSNLKALGYKVFGPFISIQKKRDQKILKNLALSISKTGKNIVILSDKSTFVGVALFEFFSKKGKKVLLKTFSEELLEPNQELFCDKLLIEKIGDLDSVETEKLIEMADDLIFVSQEGRLKEICDLPKHTLCLSTPDEDRKLFSLFETLPFLEKFFRKLSFFSSSASR